MILSTQFDRHPMLERQRIRPQVDNHIINRASGAPHQLGFLQRGRLEMHPAERALLFVEGDAALHEPRVKPMGVEFFLAKRPGKKTALVFHLLRVNNIGTSKFRFRKDHKFFTTFGLDRVALRVALLVRRSSVPEWE
jgi:hypothetical protein